MAVCPPAAANRWSSTTESANFAHWAESLRDVASVTTESSLSPTNYQATVRSPKRASRDWQLAVPVEHRFDVVPVRVKDERCVIPGVVMRAKTRRAVVAAAGFDSGAVELVNGGSVRCGEGHMNGSGRGFPFPDPEIPTALEGEPRPLRALHHLHSERLQGLLVESAAASHVTYSQGQVVDEGKRHGQRHPLYPKVIVHSQVDAIVHEDQGRASDSSAIEPGRAPSMDTSTSRHLLSVGTIRRFLANA